MQINGAFTRTFEDKWRPALDEVASMFGLESLALRRSDLSAPAQEDACRLRFAIWARGRQVGELVAVSRSPLSSEENPVELQALFAMREAIEEDLGGVRGFKRVAAVA